MAPDLLAGLDASEFLRRHWQKKPLLARGALPRYKQLLTRRELFRLAMRDEVQSRLVLRAGGRWRVEHGPFSGRRLAQLPPRGWTLLVQGVNQVLPAALDLLLEFDFLPYARLDDVMVSYAPPGGGVGPHYDSYDVFLLQIAGTRRWRVSRQRDLALVDGAPLRLLGNFRPQHEWRLGPGDMLYLPPRIAHDGVAVDECLTASIGFRAPGAQELATRFLEFLQDGLDLKGIYRDPGLLPQRRPAQIGTDMVEQVRRMLGGIKWRPRDVTAFLGQYLTEPKPHVVFAPPARPLAFSAFSRRAAETGVRLSLKTQMLFHARSVYINGERCDAGRLAAATLTRLADCRKLEPAAFDAETSQHLYHWYRAGYIELGEGSRAAGMTRKKPA